MSDSTVSAPSEKTIKPRIVSIQVCRGLAAMLVVFCHIGSFEKKYFHTAIMGIFRNYGNVGVDLFFVISGVVISVISLGKFKNSNNAAAFIYHRLARIYPIYWFYFLIVLTAYLYRPSLFSFGLSHHVDILRSCFLIPYQYDNILGQAWTLSYEVCFYFAFYFLILLTPERLAHLLLFLWGGVVAAKAMLFPEPTQVGLLPLFTSPLILEFLAGCLLFHIYHRTILRSSVGKIFIVLAGLWLAAAILWTNNASGSSVAWLTDSSGYRTRVAVFGTFAFLFLFGIMELERSSQMRFARPLEAIGDWSYSIYLSHTLVISVVGRCIVHYAPNVKFGILIIGAAAIPLVIFVGYLSYTWIERPLANFLYKRPQRITSLLMRIQKQHLK